jgi:TPR repeat protein
VGPPTFFPKRKGICRWQGLLQPGFVNSQSLSKSGEPPHCLVGWIGRENAVRDCLVPDYAQSKANGYGFPATGTVLAFDIDVVPQVPYAPGMESMTIPKASFPSPRRQMNRILFALALLPNLMLAAKQDAKSIAEIRAQAERGDALALDKLGLYYLNGDGVPKDVTEGLRLIRLAAEQGNTVAQKNMGAFYHQGSYGLSKDGAESVRWYGMAADQGSAPAHYILGKRYATGDGVPKDEIEALARFKLATGVEGAGAERRRLERQVGPEGTRAAQKRSDAIRAEIKARKAKVRPTP